MQRKINLEEVKKKPVSKLKLDEALESNRYEEFREYTFEKFDKLLK